MHIEKYTLSAAPHILIHNEPSRARANRKNVDNSKTKYNYNLLDSNKSGMENLKEILNNKNVYCSPRKDVNVLCSCVVTAPDNLPLGREKEFFYLTAKFLQERYKNCPCLSAWVHFDETQSHIHYDFIPLVYDHKKQRWKCRAKDVVNLLDLKTLHTDFQSYINSQMGLSLNILNGKTANGNKTITELKTETLKKQIQQEKNDIKKLKQLKNKLQNEIEYELIR